MDVRSNWIGPYQLMLIAVVALFGGRAFQMVWWDAPFRVILWDEQLMSPLLSLFNVDWSDYLAATGVNRAIEIAQIIWGILLGIAVIISIKLKDLIDQVAIKFIYWTAALSLLFLAILFFKERHYQIGQLVEYSLQVGTPFFFWYYVKNKLVTSKLAFWMLVASALTFVGHGLYAYGYHPVPGHFQQMVMSILGIGNQEALLFLKWAGILDFLAAAALIIPGRVRIIALGYMVFWGIGTTGARLWANFPYETFSFLMERWLFEFLIRLPHFMIPLLLLLHYTKDPGSQRV